MEDNFINTGGVSLVNKFSNLSEEEIKNKLTESKFKIQKKSKKKFFSFKNLFNIFCNNIIWIFYSFINLYNKKR